MPAAWLAGTLWQLQQAVLAPPDVLAALMALAVAAAALAARWRAKAAGLAAGLAAAALLGFASTSWRAQERLAERLPPQLEGQDLEVQGIVAELPRNGVLGPRFLFEVEQAWHRGAPVAIPRRLSLAWYRSVEPDALLLGPAVGLSAGQRWRFTVRLRQPHGALNPHGFDLELWLFERGIRASGSVRSRAGDAARLLAERAGVPVERWRQAVRDAIERQVADPATSGVLAALAIGDQAAIERDDWALFRDTGVAHLMSISGLHVTMLAWLAAAGIGALWRRSATLVHLSPAQQAGRWGGLALAASYAVLAGWGVPAQRTVLMLAVVVMLRSGARRWPLHLVLLAAAWAVALADPWALLQPGFWLSFTAVALLVAAEPVRSGSAPSPALGGALGRLRRSAASAVRTQAVATVGLAPLTLVFFQQLSVVGFVANLVAIPLVTLLITPLALLGMLAPPLWSAAALLVEGLGSVLSALARVPFAVWSAAAAPPWAVASGLLGGALALLPLPGALRALALPLVLPLLWPALERPAPGRFELVAVDIGQGTAVLVRTRHHLLLYDAGPRYSSESDAGGRVLLPLLRARGERRIDLLVLSHRDSDHVGGAASVLAAMDTRALSSSLAPDHPLLSQGVPHRRCEAGQTWQWDGVLFEVLHPRPEAYAAPARSNALSCVLRIAGAQGPAGGAAPAGAGFGSALLTGDIEAAQEAALVERLGAGLASDVLVVPHHGSRSSSTPQFIDAVAPRVALVQAAYRSRFGHPAPEVIERYAERDVAVQRSDRCGAWTLPAAGAPRCQREAARRYWHHTGAPAGD